MRDQAASLPLWLVLILPFAKILSTSLSIGSGGSGGIFGPGMVIGGMLGASFWRLFHALLPGMPADPAPFVIIGMIGMFGGIAHAPLAVLLMVAEMTGNLSLMAPAMIVVAISTAVTGNNTIYRSQLPDRSNSPVHRVRMSFPLLSSLLVRDALTPCETLLEDAPAVAALPCLERDPSCGLTVLDEKGEFAGVLTSQQINALTHEEARRTPLREMAIGNYVRLHPDDHMDVALEQLTANGLSWAPIVQNSRVIGKLTVKDAIATYRNTLERSIRRTHALPESTVLFEARLNPTSPPVGKTLRAARFPVDTLVVSITRQGATIFPHADTVLQSEDVIVVMADPATEKVLYAFLGDAHVTGVKH